jgi:hypothetical protein
MRATRRPAYMHVIDHPPDGQAAESLGIALVALDAAIGDVATAVEADLRDVPSHDAARLTMRYGIGELRVAAELLRAFSSGGDAQ